MPTKRKIEIATKTLTQQNHSTLEKQHQVISKALSDYGKEWGDTAEMLWVVLANVSEGDWSKQTPEWQKSAAKWRDRYFKAIETYGEGE